MKGSRYLAGVVLGISCGVSLTAAEERPASWRFDFGSGDVAPGFMRVVATSIYSDEQGYGFDLGSKVECFDRGGRDPLERDLCTSNGSFFFSVKVPEGNYRVTATFGDGKAASLTTVKAESRRLMIERLATPAGGFETRTFVVNVRNNSLGPKGEVKLKPRETSALHWDDKLTIEFGDDRPAIAALEITRVDEAPTVFLAGDSTVTDQTTEPWAAWGQMLPRFFGPGVAIANHAESGETLKAFVAENRLAKVLSLVKAGDYLFIQFNHNDQKPGPNHLDAFTTYKDQVKLFIAAARERAATPVLVTSMLRRNFDAAGRIVNTLGDYPEALRQIAREEGVALIDLFNASKAFYEALGPEVSKHAFVHYPAGSFPGQDQELKDDTHFSPYGAYQLARAVVEGIKAQVPALARHLTPGIPTFDPSRPDPISAWTLPATPVPITPTPAPQVPAAQRVSPNLETNIERPLRYRPDDVDFVIEDGKEYFNRPLYGGNTAFRVDGGDKPEFVLYLPGRGGNLRFALRSPAGVLWLHNAVRITTRYRPGELHYEIQDPLLGASGVLRLSAVALPHVEGVIVHAEASGIPADRDLLWAYGGVNGQRGRRDGDIGTEDVPISEWFQLKPVFSEGNRFVLNSEGFTLQSPAGVIAGFVPDGARQRVGDAGLWNDLPALLASDPSGAPGRPVVLGAAPITNGKPVLLSLERLTPGSPATLSASELPMAQAEAQEHFAALRTRVSIHTPDPFLNAAMGALNVAVDAAWDEPQRALMHGAIAWRRKLLGWRGAYALDALGWPDRAKAHYKDWATRQNMSPIKETLPPPDEDANLARSEAALHSQGDLSNSHYDMNAVYIDAFFRHLLWTGDMALAKTMWPVIERHLAWERRLFRREFGPDKLPLYEAYAMIWASDDLQYSGGGTAHASAYNYWHNTMAARVAALIGEDGEPYKREAALIARAMRTHLWMPDRRMFAETKDWLGLQRLHPSAGLWSFYIPIDSEVATPQEGWDMARYVDSEIPRLPVRGPGVPVSLHTLATSSWMPYTWSINNVVMSEAVHAALAYWRAGRPEEAWRITKGSLLAAMFMGISPGNVGSMSYLDVYRRESQRDFADGSGVLSRALVEGLFGIRPDALAGELTIAPGLPQEWDQATLDHPSVRFAYSRKARSEVFTVQARFERAMTLRLLTPVAGETADVLIDGRVAESSLIPGPFPRLEVVVPPASKTEIRITWSGKPPARSEEPGIERKATASIGPLPDLPAGAKLEAINLEPHFNDRVTEIFRPGKYRSPRSPFVSLALPSQGIGYWAGHVNATADIDDRGLRAAAAADGTIRLPGGLSFATPGPGDSKNIVFTSQWDNYPREVTVPLSGQARLVYLLMAGSTNAMQSRLENGEVVVTYTDGTTSRRVLRNPETWWPIEQDYFIDDYQFRLEGPLPLRVDLKTGRARKLDRETFKGQGGVVPGGAATVLHLPLDPDRQLRSLTVRALANDVVIGLLAASLVR